MDPVHAHRERDLPALHPVSQCTTLHVAPASPACLRTSLEAVDRCGYLNSTREQVREAGKGHRKEDSKGGGKREEGCLGVDPIDLPGRIHVDNGNRIIVVWSLYARATLVNIWP